MLNEERKAYYMFLGLAIYAAIFWFYSDAISNWAVSADILGVWMVYYFSSPLVLASIFIGHEIGKRKNKSLAGMVSGVLVIFALDLISIPKSLMVSCPLKIPVEPQLALFSDTSLAKALLPYVSQDICIGSFNIMSALIYVAVPIIFFIISFKLLGYGLWKQKIQNGG